MEDKNIDRLFQEKLKDFEVTPNPEIWQQIESKLSKSKKRRILPFWWFSGAAIASVFLALIILQNTSKETIIKEQIIVSPSKKESIINNKTFFNKEQNDPSNKVIVNKEEENKYQKSNKLNSENKKEEREEKETKKLFLMKEGIAKVDVREKKKEGVIKGLPSNKKVAMNTLKENKKENSVVENQIPFKAIKEKEILENKKEKTFKRWSVSPVVGIVTSNSFSKNSSIDASLNNNTISSDETIAYGAKISYKLNKKWSIQSGVQVQKVVFNTENVGLLSSVSSSNESSNIDFRTNDSPQFISLEDVRENLSADFPFSGSNTTLEIGTLEQTYSYIEVPVEVKYHVFSTKKIRTSVVSGVSTLFLNSNSISAKTATTNKELGSANNLNTINFSGNLGVDLDVHLSNKIKFNINPMFKTQLSTFSKNSNGFQPYTFGIYTGLKYEF